VKRKKEDIDPIQLGQLQLPFSKEAESCLLGAMILKNEKIPEILVNLEDDPFFLDSNKEIFEHIKRVYNNDKKVDLVMLKDSLGDKIQSVGGIEYLGSLAETVPNADNWVCYVTVLNKKSRLRKFIELSDNIKRLAYDGAAFNDIYSEADKIKSFCPSSGGKSISEMSTIAKEIIAYIRKSGWEMTFGFKDIDSCVGGLRRRLVYTIGGKTSHGKTTFVNNLVLSNLAKGKRVLMSVYENPDLIPMRLAAIDSKLPLFWFIKPEQISEDAYNGAIQAVTKLDRFEGNLKIVGACHLAGLKSIAEKFKPDIIILDYIQEYAKLFLDGSTGTKASEVGRAASEFAQLNVELNTAGILVSQFSRRTEEEKGRRPGLSDFKESGDLENRTDVALLLYWPWRDTSNPKIDMRLYEVNIAKNRNGPPGVCQLKVDPETLRLSDWEESEKANFIHDGDDNE